MNMLFLKKQEIAIKLIGTNFRLKIMFLILLVISLISLIYIDLYRPDVRYCYLDTMNLEESGKPITTPTENYAERLEDILLAKKHPRVGKTIFFHETNCSQMFYENAGRSIISSLFAAIQQSSRPPPINYVKLTARAACAIESAARHHPNHDVFVLFASPRYHWPNNTIDPIISALKNYKNIYLRNLNLWSYAADTPIHKWLIEGQLFKSEYIKSHTSDVLRYLTLWRWGGLYLDMDIVMLRSMETLPANYVAAESVRSLAAGVLHFAPSGIGRTVAENCLTDLEKNFKAKAWGNNGPGVITRVLKKLCNANTVMEMVNATERCDGFHVYSKSRFYAIPYKKWKNFFITDQLNDTMNAVKSSYLIHLWNRFSYQTPIKVGTKCAYALIAEKHCPLVYKTAGEYYEYF